MKITTRRDQHIENSLKVSYEGNTMLEDIYIEHNSLPELDFNEIDTSSYFLGKKIDFPLLINSITGGTERGSEINEGLYMLSKQFNIPMAVGNQGVIFDEDISEEMFLAEDMAVDVNRSVVISNLSAKSSMDRVSMAMEMIKADAVSMYLNSAQEIVIKDGERNFTGVLENIEKASRLFPGKVIIKEVGFGMSKEVIKKLVDSGVDIIDISGHGGTNFIEIENLRDFEYDYSDLYSWGVPTAKSILNARSVSDDIKIIASGGIKNSMDIAKSLIIGADYVGIGGELLKYLLHGGYEYAAKYLEELIYKTKIIMFLLGAKNIEDLKKTPYKIVGNLKEII